MGAIFHVSFDSGHPLQLLRHFLYRFSPPTNSLTPPLLAGGKCGQDEAIVLTHTVTPGPACSPACVPTTDMVLALGEQTRLFEGRYQSMRGDKAWWP